jgi:hypothetical protein
VFCSRTKPAIMAEQNGQTMAFFLAPFATQESRESVRQNANFHALYFAICHGREAGRAAVNSLAGVAQSLGYRVALAQSKLVPMKRAEDVVAGVNDPGARPPPEARLDEPPRRAPAEAQREERAHRPPGAAMAQQDRQVRHERRSTPSQSLEREDDGLLSGARRLTNRAFDALDGMFRNDRD